MHILWLVGNGHLALQGVDNTDFSWQIHGFVEIQGLGMGHHHNMHHLNGSWHIELLVWWEVACNVAILWNGPRLIEGCPFLYSVTEVLKADFGVVYEVVNQISVEPVTIVEEWQRSVKMMESYERLYPLLDTLVNQVIIIINTCLVDSALALWQDAGPRNGNPDAVDAKVMGQL